MFFDKNGVEQPSYNLISEIFLRYCPIRNTKKRMLDKYVVDSSFTVDMNNGAVIALSAPI